MTGDVHKGCGCCGCGAETARGCKGVNANLPPGVHAPAPGGAGVPNGPPPGGADASSGGVGTALAACACTSDRRSARYLSRTPRRPDAWVIGVAAAIGFGLQTAGCDARVSKRSGVTGRGQAGVCNTGLSGEVVK